MKKILFLLLALLAVCSAALAERGVIDFTRTGIRFNAPEVFLNAEGGALMSRYDYGEITDGVLIGVMPYLGHTEAETQALFEGRPFAYHIQVVDLPDGYSETDAEYYTGLRSGTLMVEVVRE